MPKNLYTHQNKFFVVTFLHDKCLRWTVSEQLTMAFVYTQQLFKPVYKIIYRGHR